MHCPIRHLEKIHSCVQDYIVHRSFFFFFTTSVLKKNKKLCKALDLCFTGWHSVLALLPPVLLSTFLVPFCSPAGGLMPLPCPCSLALPSPIFFLFCFVFGVCVSEATRASLASACAVCAAGRSQLTTRNAQASDQRGNSVMSPTTAPEPLTALNESH